MGYKHLNIDERRKHIKNALRTKKHDTYRRVAGTQQGYDQQGAIA